MSMYARSVATVSVTVWDPLEHKILSILNNLGWGFALLDGAPPDDAVVIGVCSQMNNRSWSHLI